MKNFNFVLIVQINRPNYVLFDAHQRRSVDWIKIKNQYIYQIGKTCELAIHRVVSCAEKGISDKEIALIISCTYCNLQSIKRAVESKKSTMKFADGFIISLGD